MLPINGTSQSSQSSVQSNPQITSPSYFDFDYALKKGSPLDATPAPSLASSTNTLLEVSAYMNPFDNPKQKKGSPKGAQTSTTEITTYTTISEATSMTDVEKYLVKQESPDSLKVKQLEFENNTLKAELKEVYEKLNDKEMRFHKMEIELKSLDEKYKKLSDKHQSEKQTLKDEIKNLQDQSLKNLASGYESEVKDIEAKFQSSKNESALYEQAYQKTKVECDELRNTNQKLNKQVSEFETALNGKYAISYYVGGDEEKSQLFADNKTLLSLLQLRQEMIEKLNKLVLDTAGRK